MLPPALLRPDAEEAELTAAGAAADPSALPPLQGAILRELAQAGRSRIPALLARAGAASRAPLDALVQAGVVRIRRRRRDRPPRVDVTAVRLQDGPLEELLERAGKARRQREVILWLAEQGRPVLQQELVSAVPCSPSVVTALVRKDVLQRFKQAPPRRPRWSLGGTATRPTLTPEQETAVTRVAEACRAARFTPFVLEGVTGSGKTEVYLRALEEVLESGRRGLVLVPEIGLTPAAVGAVERRFGERVAVLHSAQSEGERWIEWNRVRRGEADVVVGPRSALFAPMDRLGLIVVDEEHDSAYKQQESPRYNARDLALVLGQRLEAPVLLCSATPSLESMALVERGLAHRLVLTRRVAGGRLPEVELVDLRGEPPEPGEHGHVLFSRRLLALLEETLSRGEQAILLMQRRGWAPILLCRDCGHKIECPQCSVAMVVHRRQGGLRCHYCGAKRPVPEACPACQGTLLETVGAGTEKVAARLRERFPDLSLGILDRDTVRRKGALQEVLGAFSAGRLRVLVGTQMVAKGHHFPNVTLTGVISADALLGLPDFRSGERTFQLLTQVAGRAGRGDRPGRVVIQTYYPDHPAIRHASAHDVRAFATEELVFRRSFGYPPATRMAVVRFESPSNTAAGNACSAAADAARPLPEGVRLRGPAPAPLERLRGHWRWQLLGTARNRTLLRQVLERVEALRLPGRVRRIIDVDPLSTL
jgi:primosomal protein N' (replication factor Y)